MVCARRRQQRAVHARLRRGDPNPLRTRHFGRRPDCRQPDGSSRSGRRVGRAGRMERRARLVGTGKSVAHTQQRRCRSGAEYRCIRCRSGRYDRLRRVSVGRRSVDSAARCRGMPLRLSRQHLQARTERARRDYGRGVLPGEARTSQSGLRRCRERGGGAGRRNARQHTRGDMFDTPSQTARYGRYGQCRQLLQESRGRCRSGRCSAKRVSRHADISGCGRG